MWAVRCIIRYRQIVRAIARRRGRESNANRAVRTGSQCRATVVGLGEIAASLNMADLKTERTGIGHSDCLCRTGGSDELAREGQAARRYRGRGNSTLPCQFDRARTACRIVGDGQSTGARSCGSGRESDLDRARTTGRGYCCTVVLKREIPGRGRIGNNQRVKAQIPRHANGG